jgi:uncharacterized protein (DUF433 family)/DNA-binding transcriptional MerR regulator
MPQPYAKGLSEQEQLQVREAFRLPRGRYTNERASQIAGVPSRTIYHWAHEDLLVPDFAHETPRMWSYRDLVMLRLFAWFRARKMPPERAAAEVARVRSLLAEEAATLSKIRSDGKVVYLDESVEDVGSSQLAIAEAVMCLGQFDLMAPLEKAGPITRLWGPNLIRPTARTSISPWVLAGDPCVRDSRIPTATLFALSYERGLEPLEISFLYDDLSDVAVVEAIKLEKRMRSPAAAVV